MNRRRGLPAILLPAALLLPLASPPAGRAQDPSSLAAAGRRPGKKATFQLSGGPGEAARRLLRRSPGIRAVALRSGKGEAAGQLVVEYDPARTSVAQIAARGQERGLTLTPVPVKAAAAC